MSKISQFFSTNRGRTNFNRREIYYGPTTATFTAASPGLVEVNCWGGGGNGGPQAGGGGGGAGYVRYIYDLSAGDQLSISVAGAGGTSSVSCPTQSPISPIIATGGLPGSTFAAPYPTTGVDTDGGAGGVGVGTVPSSRVSYLLTRDGGTGSNGHYDALSSQWFGGGGGAAGNEYADGTSNVADPLEPFHDGTPQYPHVIAGAGIAGAGDSRSITTWDPTINPHPTGLANQVGTGGPGNWHENLGAPKTSDFENWFFSYEQRGGQGGRAAIFYPEGPLYSITSAATDGGFLAGGAGGNRFGPGTGNGGYNTEVVQASNGGYGGGGGGGGQNGPSYPVVHGQGGAGVVIVYYVI